MQLEPTGQVDDIKGLSEAAFRKIAEFMRERTGISLDRGSRRIVHSRLQRHVIRTGARDLDEYVEFLVSDPCQDEVDHAISALTTNTTKFFREPEHFDIFAELVVPLIVRAARNGERVRLWSAACSSGEEPYTLAATLLRAFPDAPNHDIRILATDIDRTVLERAKAAEYARPAPALVSDEMARFMFDPIQGSDDRVQIKQPLRDLVTVRYLNFFDPWPVSGPFHAIFCRNAAIYMDSAAQETLWSGLARVLHSDGALFIGHSERLTPQLYETLAQIGRNAFRPAGSANRAVHKAVHNHRSL